MVSPLLALKAQSKHETSKFITHELAPEFSGAGILSERTKERIKEYEKSYQSTVSLNAPMSLQGIQVLIRLYNFIDCQ